jgi:hypothetical protein
LGMDRVVRLASYSGLSLCGMLLGWLAVLSRDKFSEDGLSWCLPSLCVDLCHQTLFTELYVCIDPAVSMFSLNETSRNLTIVVFLLFVYLFMAYLTTLSVSRTK